MIRISIDYKKRRLLIHDPVSLELFAKDGWLLRLVENVCGSDAIADAVVSGRLQPEVRMAFCAPVDSATWRAELDATPASP